MQTTDFEQRQRILFGQQRPRLLPYWLGHFLVYVGLLTLSLVIVWLLYKTNRIYTSYQTITRFATTLQADPAGLDWAEAGDSLRNISSELEALPTELAPFLPLTPYLEWVPVYGSDLAALPYLVALGHDLGRIGLMFDDMLTPLLEAGPDVKQGEALPAAIDNLAQAGAELQEMEQQLQQHQLILDQLNPAELSPPVAQLVVQLRQYLPDVITGLQLAQSLPTLLGAETPRTYLIITQNSDELRPSGGYINAAGHLVVEKGQIVELVMQDSYAIDQLSEEYPYPPDPIHQYMAADYWVLRDASWSPDFPTAARMVLVLYELGQGIAADGVIAIDQHALPFLLRALGPVSVEGERVTSDNVIKLMRQQWAPEAGQNLDGDWWLQRKSFMLSLAETVRHKFERDFSSANLPVLAEALQAALAEKHLLIYLNDPLWADILAERNWDGSLRPVQGDYLMVADANLGFNKASAIVERRLSYRVDLAQDGSAEARANLFYQHMAHTSDSPCLQKPRYDPLYEQNMERCYWDYVRLIVPAGAELLSGPKAIVESQYLLRGKSTTGNIDSARLGLDKISWGQLFLLAPGQTLSLDYAYRLPAGTVHQVQDHQKYELYLQKQPGTLESNAEVTITLPPGAQLLESKPSPLSRQGDKVAYLLNLKTDQVIEILYKE